MKIRQGCRSVLAERRNVGGEWLRGHLALLLLALVFLCFSVASPAFLSWMNLKNLLLQNTHMLILVAGLSIIMLGGDVDLSVGYQISLISVVAGRLLLMQPHVWPAIAGGLLTAVLCGTLNGFLVSMVDILPFAATLATLMLYRGISYMLAGQANFTQLPSGLRGLTRTLLLGLPLDVWLAILCLAAVGFLFQFTYFGRYIRAMGEDEAATRRAGVDVSKMRWGCYIVGSLFFALAAFVMISKQGTVSASAGIGLEVNGIAAIMVGGVSLYRSGSGSHEVRLANIIAGMFVLAAVENGIQLLGGSLYAQYIVVGVIVIFAMIANHRK